ncbi:MAG: Gfo/Idh/MocA family oxidoreductase [Pseudomonadota bacterium]
MATFRVCVIGTGFAAKQHAKNFSAIDGCDVIGVCSRSRPRAVEFAAAFGSVAYDNVDKMLQTERPDVVSVATGEYDHVDPVVKSLSAGAHVFCEKMLAHNVESAQDMIQAAREAKREIGVNYNYRFVPGHQVIHSALVDGLFGEPKLFIAHTHSYLWPHLLDTVRYLFGDPLYVQACSFDEPMLRPRLSGSDERSWLDRDTIVYHPSACTSATLAYPDRNFQVILAASSVVPMADHWWSFTLYGREAFVKVDNATRDRLNGERVQGLLADNIRSLGNFSYEDTFSASIKAFVKSLAEGAPLPVAGEDGLKTMLLDRAVATAAATKMACEF